MLNHRPISISEQVFEQLEKDILSGKYRKGEIVNELKLSEELGVSRTPVRESLSRLQQEHLLEDTGKGLIVVGISRQDMMDMYEIRLRLEGLATEMAAKNITQEALDEIGETLEMQNFFYEKALATGEDRSDKIKDLDSRFHEIIHESCGSNSLRDVLQPIHKKITKYRKASVQKKSRAAESLKEHYAIYEALKSRDAEKASELMLLHVKNARDSIAQMPETDD